MTGGDGSRRRAMPPPWRDVRERQAASGHAPSPAAGRWTGSFVPATWLAMLPFPRHAAARMSDSTSPPSPLPNYRPRERFWPYTDLTEQPTEEELVALD